jgi:hypothetical protein
MEQGNLVSNTMIFIPASECVLHQKAKCFANRELMGFLKEKILVNERLAYYFL